MERGSGKREHDNEKAPVRRKRQTGGRTRAGKAGFVLGTLLLICVLTSVFLVGIFMAYVKISLGPTLEVEPEDYTMSLSSIIYYEDKESGDWEELQMIRSDENRIPVPLDKMPDELWQAAVAIEDQRFFDHKGVDWWRTGGATVNMFLGMRNTFGGSTITQQMLKNVTGDWEGTVNRKVREIFRALEFEKAHSKEEILELYLNSIYFGKTCYGVQTASLYYFGKDVSKLTLAECASLIAITNNPSKYGPLNDIKITMEDKDGNKVVKTPRELNKQRQENILDKMADKKTGLCYITQEEADAAKAEELHFTDGSTSAADLVAIEQGVVGDQDRYNSFFVDQVIRDVSRDMAKKMSISEKEARKKIYYGGYQIYTTIDPKIQDMAESVYEDPSNLQGTSASGQNLRSGITIVDVNNGNVVAMVGDVGEKTGDLVWNFATDVRQPGSSIKPLTVYAPALDAGAVTMASTFDDYPVRLYNGNPWPKNSPNKYRGMVTLEQGVASSINTVAVQTLEKLGVTKAYSFATENLNLDLVPADMDVSPLGLGGLTYGLSTVEMAAAYASFANGGVYNEPRFYVEVRDSEGEVVLKNEQESHVAMKDTTAYFMNKLLKNAVANGTGRGARFSGMTIAGKTGTTNKNHDRYFSGYTPYYSAAVWVGYKNSEKVVYSGNPASAMWRKVMSKVHADLPDKPFPEPSGELVTVNVCMDSGLLASDACTCDVRGSRVRSVQVAAGTAPKQHCSMHVMRSYCTAGKCLAGPNCPEESVIQAAFLDHPRKSYPGIYAADSGYTLAGLSTAACPVHSGILVEIPGLDDEEEDGEPNEDNTVPDDQTTPEEDTETPAEPQKGKHPIFDIGGLSDANDWWQKRFGKDGG